MVRSGGFLRKRKTANVASGLEKQMVENRLALENNLYHRGCRRSASLSLDVD